MTLKQSFKELKPRLELLKQLHKECENLSYNTRDFETRMFKFLNNILASKELIHTGVTIVDTNVHSRSDKWKIVFNPKGMGEKYDYESDSYKSKISKSPDDSDDSDDSDDE